jgi:hypothetical protein
LIPTKAELVEIYFVYWDMEELTGVLRSFVIFNNVRLAYLEENSLIALHFIEIILFTYFRLHSAQKTYYCIVNKY